ncbi:hypothetical protein PG984_005597 [Apiospora sp. TS-2023a]
MAEALGLAASVAGLLSLGLQVTGGVASYLDALENRQEELASAKRQNEALVASLEIVKTASTHVLSHHAHTVATSIQSCEAELRSVEDLLADLANCDTSTWRQRLRSKKKKLSYRFDRSKVQQLVQRLHNSNQVLQLALAGLNLEMTSCSVEKLTAIESSTSGHGSELLVLRSEVAAAITPLTDMRNRVVTTEQLQESNRAMQGMFESSHESLQLELSLQSEKIARVEKLLETLQSPDLPSRSMKRLAHKVAGKPAVLKELCDTTWALDQEPYQLPDHGSIRVQERRDIPAIEPICICPRSHRSGSRKTMWLGHLGLSEDRESRGHWPGCPLSGIQSTQKHRRTVGFKYTGLTRLLYSIVGASFTLTSGAGGFSIGANLTYYPTVDSSSDPSFRILSLITLHYLSHHNTEETGALFMVASTKRLQSLFDEKKVCPTAVNGWNWNLLYCAMIAYGVPASTYDDQGVSPLGRICTRERPTKEVEEIIQLLVLANPEGKPVVVNPLKWAFRGDGPWTTNTSLLYGVSHGYTEACDCGPLSTAVIRNDIDEVARILDRFPSSILEIDIYGQSPLHLAATKPGILSRLVQAADIDTIKRVDKAGISAIEVAIMRSGDRCIHAPASELAKRRYIFEFQRRIIYRTKTSWKSLFHHDKANAADALIDGIVSCYINSNRESNEVGQYGWVYEEICDTHMADLFYRHGFRPSPSFLLDGRHNLIRYLAGTSLPNVLYIGWLVEHGVDLFVYISRRSPTREDNPDLRVFGAHYAFLIIGLNHTCCDAMALAWDGYSRRPNDSSWLEADDVASINEDQAPLLELLEALVAEFTEMAVEYQERGCFKSFWAKAWIGRIQKELVKLDGDNLSDVERRGAEEIGVRWCEPPSVKETEDENPYERGSTEWLPWAGRGAGIGATSRLACAPTPISPRRRPPAVPPKGARAALTRAIARAAEDADRVHELAAGTDSTAGIVTTAAVAAVLLLAIVGGGKDEVAVLKID